MITKTITWFSCLFCRVSLKLGVEVKKVKYFGWFLQILPVLHLYSSSFYYLFSFSWILCLEKQYFHYLYFFYSVTLNMMCFFISFIISWNELPYIISNFCWQPDWMWNQLRQAPLVRSVGIFPERRNTEETIFFQSGCHLPEEAQMWQSLREKLYCILTACFLLQLKSSSYPVATSTTATDLICWHQRAFRNPQAQQHPIGTKMRHTTSKLTSYQFSATEVW